MTVTRTIPAREGILVAHDGSVEADSALRTAARCAPVFGRRVHVVRAWTITTAPTPPDATAGYVPGIDAFEAAVLTELDEAVEATRAENEDVEISTAVVHGSAPEALVAASDRFALIVMGSRGRGGFAGLMLGSTSAQVVQHARCAVLVDRGLGALEQQPVVAGEGVMERALVSELGLDDRPSGTS